MQTLTAERRREIAFAARKEQCRRSLAEFARQAWHVLEPATDLKWGWALDAICEHLEAVTSGGIRRLLMNVPPGTMKSLLTGVIWPAWEWGPKGQPEKRFVGTAHAADLAVRDNMKCRRLIQSEWYQARWPIVLTGDQNAKTKFENTRTGSRQATAFAGITGFRGDRIILDDPHSVKDANSAALLAGDVELFREALPSRVNNDESAIVIIMQRLHEADVSAVALTLGYDHLCIPMRFEPGRNSVTRIGWADPRTIDGELMFPERFPDSQVIDLETSLGSYAAAGQLQQRPAPRAGGMFQRRWFPIVDAVPAGMTFVRDWDLAATVAKPGLDPDWTAGVKMGRDGAGFHYIVDLVRFRGSSHEVEMAVMNTARQDGIDCTISLKQDPSQAGKAQAEAYIRMLAGFIVKVTREGGSKETRASPFAAQCEAGNVRIVRAAWNEPFLDEMNVFPFGKHDDQVDAAASAFNMLANSNNAQSWVDMLTARAAAAASMR